MKIEYYPYTLKFKKDFNVLNRPVVREGALLRTTFKDGLVGYSDCHPWVELGDLSLHEQLKSLNSFQTTALTERSLAFSREDAEARSLGKSLFDGLKVPKSYQLLSLEDSIDEYLKEEIFHFKLKAGKEPKKEILLLEKWSQMHPNIRFRLDFNEILSRQQFLEYWKSLSSKARSIIEYLEDPYPYNRVEWMEDQIHLEIPFAVDAQAEIASTHPESAQYSVYKPAKDHPRMLMKNSADIVVTSYLDHPLGQLCAAYTAAKLMEKHPTKIGLCGLLTHRCYEEDEFIQELNVVNGHLQPPGGTGLGYNRLLESLPWKSV